MNRLQLSWDQLRHVTLAQALAHADAERRLVSQTEWDEATQQALAGACARGVAHPGVADVLCQRADSVVARAAGRDATLAALAQGSAALAWAARALPLAALAAGLLLDRIANAHRVDLLSPPLLLVLAWNLAVYLLLAVRLWRRWRSAPAPARAWPALQRWLLARLGAGGARSRGAGARVAADFARRWSARSAPRFAQQAGALLHLCAAAWAAGIALSLLARGLVVSYHFGWESTFLDAAQVHAITGWLFAPLTALLGVPAFTLEEIAAAQNFAGEGVAGSRWVWMYVGLLTLVVVLPRTLLAALAAWRAARIRRSAALDLDGAEFDALRQALPRRLRVGLCCASAQQEQALRARYGAGRGVRSALGDHLGWLLASDAADTQSAIDAVLLGAGAALPDAWRDAPQAPLAADSLGRAPQAQALLAPLSALLVQHAGALARLSAALQAQIDAQRAQALQALAAHLHASAALVTDDGAGALDAERYARLLEQLDAALTTAYGGFPASAALPAALARARAERGDTPLATDGAALVVGGSAGAAAGAAAGAKVGALIDAGSGGLTLGVGTALGALLGGSAAWALRALQKKGDGRDAREQLLRQMLEAALLHYLLHSRVLAQQQLQAQVLRWQAHAAAAIQAQWPALVSAWGSTDTLTTALAALLDRLDAAPAERGAEP